MYRLPADVQRKLRSKFPDITELDNIVDAVFEEIREKAFDDGSCTIQKFGSFYAYKAFSKKRGAFVPRLKFRISRALLQNMIDDDYTLQRITKVVDRVFEKDKEKDPNYVRVRNINAKNQTTILNNQRKIREKTKVNVIEDEISKILSEETEEK